MNINIKLHTKQNMRGHKLKKHGTNTEEKTSRECCQTPAEGVWKDPGVQGYTMHIMTKEADGKGRSQNLPGHVHEERA